MVWIVALGIILSFLLFMASIAYRMVKPPRLAGKWKPKDFGFDYEDVEFKTEDGLTLSGWWIDNGSNKTVIPLHGYSVSRWDDTYMKETIRFFLKEGYNVLTFDFRAHGRSEGNYITENKAVIDTKASVRWLRNNYTRKVKKIAIVGFSMGATSMIRILSEINEICCGVADSPPIYADKTGARGLKYFVNLPEWLYPFVKPFIVLFGRSKPVYMLAYADKVKKPLLLIAGEKDPLVKVEEVKDFYEQNKKINKNLELWITDAAHVRALKFYPKEWKEKVGEFIRKYIS